MANIAAAFTVLPEKIKDWINSIDVTDLIIDIGSEFELADDKKPVISRLIMRMVAQDINPRDFTGELVSQLEIDNQKAREITSRVYDGILKPIEADLKNAGIDVNLMVGYARPLSAVASQRRDGVAARAESAPPDNLPTLKPKITPAQPDKPFILHTEEEEPAAGEDGGPTKPSFRYFLPDKGGAEPSTKAEVEGLRVVHYSSFLTQLNQADPNLNKTKIPMPKSKWFV